MYFVIFIFYLCSAGKNIEGHHRSGFTIRSAADQKSITVSAVEQCFGSHFVLQFYLFRRIFSVAVLFVPFDIQWNPYYLVFFQKIAEMMEKCYKSQPELICLRMVFNDDAFWAK